MLVSPSSSKWNPNPITKMFCTILLGMTLLRTLNTMSSWIIVLFISFLFFINGFKKDAIKGVILYLLLFKLQSFEQIEHFPAIVQMFIGLFIVIKMFYVPFLAGKFLIKSSDVGSIISSMDKLKITKNLSIPIAVMFRFFPSFREEKKNIKRAMKIRGISMKNPIAYLEYVSVPLLILSSNISDDIAKAAETKCIENPIKKTRYREVRIGLIDFIYSFVVIFCVVGELLW